MRGRQFDSLLDVKGRSRSIGLKQESLNEYLHWLSLAFSQLLFPSKVILSMLL